MARNRTAAWRPIDNRNRVTLSPEALEALGAGPGDIVLVEVHGRTVRLRAADVVPREG